MVSATVHHARLRLPSITLELGEVVSTALFHAVSLVKRLMLQSIAIKQQKYETANVRNNGSTKQRKYETTKVQNFKNTKL